jgi:hypothetical protein
MNELTVADLASTEGLFIVCRETPTQTWRQPSVPDWNRFVNEVVKPSDGEVSAVNGLPFAKLSKMYGNAYLEYVYCAYSCIGDTMTEDAFCQYYGGVPKGFFDKKIKHETFFNKSPIAS